MEIYYVTTQPDTQGAYEVHTSTCSLLPAEGRRYSASFQMQQKPSLLDGTTSIS